LGLFGVRKWRLAAAETTQTSIIAVVSSFEISKPLKVWIGQAGGECRVFGCGKSLLNDSK